MSDERDAQIRDRAYRIWQSEGEPEGRDQDHWSQAERELDDEDAAPVEPAARAPGKPTD